MFCSSPLSAGAVSCLLVLNMLRKVKFPWDVLVFSHDCTSWFSILKVEYYCDCHNVELLSTVVVFHYLRKKNPFFLFIQFHGNFKSRQKEISLKHWKMIQWENPKMEMRNKTARTFRCFVLKQWGGRRICAGEVLSSSSTSCWKSDVFGLSIRSKLSEFVRRMQHSSHQLAIMALFQATLYLLQKPALSKQHAPGNE